MEHTIDAKGRSVGRVATEAASLLMGKHRPDFTRNNVSDDRVTIVNASRARFTGPKLAEKEYVRYSGYPGGLKADTAKRVVEKKGMSEILKLAVYGMLPRNKLRTPMMKKLTINL